jgi:hypothetical protein
MGLMDKVKAQAEQAVAKAQHGIAEGKDKLEGVQAKRHVDQLLHDLGAAYYAEQREGGPHAAVEQALIAVDAAKTEAASDAAKAASSGDASGSPASGAPAGNFSLDDV